MVETILKLPFSALASLIHILLDRPRLKIECGFNLWPDEEGEGLYMAFLIKAINPTKATIYFERLEAIDAEGEVFFPMIMGSDRPKEILPQRNILLKIPCGHIVNTTPKMISIVDATEKYHNLKGKKLSKVVAGIKAEVHRLLAAGIEVHPRTKLFNRKSYTPQ